MKEGTIIVARYELENISDRTIVIDYINPDCSCTKYTIDKKEIAKGDKAILELTFDTKNKVGKQKLNAVMKTNTKNKFYKVICIVYVNGEI